MFVAPSTSISIKPPRTLPRVPVIHPVISPSVTSSIPPKTSSILPMTQFFTFSIKPSSFGSGFKMPPIVVPISFAVFSKSLTVPMSTAPGGIGKPGMPPRTLALTQSFQHWFPSEPSVPAQSQGSSPSPVNSQV